jgi:hypothetical protein
MPTDKIVKVYQFDELEERAKERARDWYRGCMDVSDWSSVVLDELPTIAGMLGITVRMRDYKTIGGLTRSELAVSFDLDRGQYFAFSGQYVYAPDAPTKIRNYINDPKLHAIVDDLETIQAFNFGGLQATIADTYDRLTIDVEQPEDVERQPTEREIALVEDAIKRFAAWILHQLQESYDYAHSDEAIDENIRANEYEFRENGSRFTD